ALELSDSDVSATVLWESTTTLYAVPPGTAYQPVRIVDSVPLELPLNVCESSAMPPTVTPIWYWSVGFKFVAVQVTLTATLSPVCGLAIVLPLASTRDAAEKAKLPAGVDRSSSKSKPSGF